MDMEEMEKKYSFLNNKVEFLEPNYRLSLGKWPIPSGLPLVVEEDGKLVVKCIDIMQEYDKRWMRENSELAKLWTRGWKVFNEVARFNSNEKMAQDRLNETYAGMIALYLTCNCSCSYQELDYLYAVWKKENKIVDYFRYAINWMLYKDITNLYDDELGESALIKLYGVPYSFNDWKKDTN